MVHHEKSKDGAPSRSQIGNSLVRGIGAGFDLVLSTRCKSWLGFGASTAKGTGLQVHSMRGELRSHKLLSVVKRKERERERERNQTIRPNSLIVYCSFQWPSEAQQGRNQAKPRPITQENRRRHAHKANTHGHTQDEPSACREKLPAGCREAGSYLHFWAG